MLKLAPAMVRTLAVDLHSDEAQLHQLIAPLAVPATPALGHKRTVWSGVDDLNHRIFFLRIKIARSANDAVDVELAVAILGHKPLGMLPAGGVEILGIRGLQFAEQFAVAHAS